MKLELVEPGGIYQLYREIWWPVRVIRVDNNEGGWVTFEYPVLPNRLWRGEKPKRKCFSRKFFEKSILERIS